MLLIYLLLPEESGLNLAAASTVPVVYLIISPIFLRPSITDATLVFMANAFVYLVIMPWMLVTGTARAYQGAFFIYNYELLARGNIPIIVGLLCYALGMLLCSASALPRPKRRKELLLASSAGDRVVATLVIIAGLSWFIMWVRGGMPKESLLLMRARDISNPGQQDYVANGFGYLLDLARSTNTAILVYALIHPEKPLFSRQILLLLLAVLYFNSIEASRLMYALAPLSVLLLRRLPAATSRSSYGDTPAVRPSGVAALVLLAAGLFVLSVFYGQYRAVDPDSPEVTGSGLDKFAFEAGHFLYYPIIYYMVLQRVPRQQPYWYGRSYLTPLISRVPRILWPNKFSYMWTTQQFALEFYGYEEHHELDVTAKGVNLPAEGYLNFGWMGLAGTMLLLGFANEYLARRAHSREATNLFSVIYIYYLCYLIPYGWKMGVADTMMTVTPLVVLALVTWFLSPTLSIREDFRSRAAGLSIGEDFKSRAAGL
jgi:hypothetical protein